MVTDPEKLTAKKSADSPRSSAQLISMFENCVGCKWTLSLLTEIGSGVRRPGALVKTQSGLTTKVLNERLRKLMDYGILTKTSYLESPPRVEYDLTAFGQRFVEILDEIEDLRRQFDIRQQK